MNGIRAGGGVGAARRLASAVRTSKHSHPRSARAHSRYAPTMTPDEKYKLRPRTLRGRQETRSRRQPQPLSKYRRKTANARERSRMREINLAFEALRRAVPSGGATSACEKLTKITTLRLAMRYITALSNALESSEPKAESPRPERWSSPICSELSDFSNEFAPDLSTDGAEDSLSPFDSFLAEFDYIDRTFA